MWPLGQYERLVHEIKRRENPDIPVTFGLLIADYRQQKCKEYILNYITRFNYISDNYINFYLPGYLEENEYNRDSIIKIENKKYYFDEKIYMDFLYHLEYDFNIKYPYNPVLILLEYSNGHFQNSNRIIIELDKDGADIKLTGELFDGIFEIAKEYVSISDFSNELVKGKFKDGLFNNIVDCIGNSYLSAIINTRNEIQKYSLKKK